MHTITINNKQYKTEVKSTNDKEISGELNGKTIKVDFIKVRDDVYHMIKDNKSYSVEVVKYIPEDKKLILKVNNTSYTLDVKDKYDDLLHSLGLDSLASKKVNDVKAPMPGMVLNVLVTEGQEVKKGDPLIVLEAMKMENILKSPSDGTVKKIAVNKGIAVEKNQLLVQF